MIACTLSDEKSGMFSGSTTGGGGGGGGGPDTVTVGEALALPPDPVQVSEYVLLAVSAPVD